MIEIQKHVIRVEMSASEGFTLVDNSQDFFSLSDSKLVTLINDRLDSTTITESDLPTDSHDKIQNAQNLQELKNALTDQSTRPMQRRG